MGFSPLVSLCWQYLKALLRYQQARQVEEDLKKLIADMNQILVNVKGAGQHLAQPDLPRTTLLVPSQVAGISRV